MSSNTKRAAAAGGTFVIAGVVNIATGMLTQEWTVVWAATVVILVLVGGALQGWVTWSERDDAEDGRRAARGTQTVHGTKVGGDTRQSMSRPGDQTVTDSEISGSLSQSQGDADSS
ncbi:hypothetical protein [Spirillospora sp. NPDC048823]|uniref:hypothetical protein n=1 Tax=unclassified Spirillospora TaxID=2642701 RepID=UPI00371982E5